jgi:2-phosphoglycerate kinase
MSQNPRHIVISDEELALPYSKGLMASSIMATGLAPARAFHVAERIEERLHERPADSITRAELADLAYQVLRAEVGQRYADSFTKWQVVNRLDRPLIIVIGGATGVGKSTLATQLAGRLGITRIIPSDAIREVMRAMFTEELMPTLHTSSFDAVHLVRHPLPRSADPVIIGFREQAAAVAVGAHALMRRAVVEGTDLILEGAHLAPGFYDPAEFAHAVVVPMVITVDDEEVHRSHFLARAHESRSRPQERYLDFFDNIRRIQRYVKSLALERSVPIVPSYSLDSTLSQVIELVVSRAMQAIPTQNGSGDRSAGRAKQQAQEGGHRTDEQPHQHRVLRRTGDARQPRPRRAARDRVGHGGAGSDPPAQGGSHRSHSGQGHRRRRRHPRADRRKAQAGPGWSAQGR